MEMTSKQLAAVPIRSKKLEELQAAVREVLDTSVISKIRTLISDRETAILSRRFRKTVLQEYGTRVVYLSSRHKAHLAELYIRHLKSHLSMAVAANKAAGQPDYKNWVQHLSPAVRNLNRKMIPGTSFRRNTVDDSNFDELLEQLHGPGASTVWNTSSITDRSIANPKWRRRIWKFRRGQRVLVEKRALASKERFSKSSVEGGYSPEERRISGRFLKNTGQYFSSPGKAKTHRDQSEAAAVALITPLLFLPQCTA